MKAHSQQAEKNRNSTYNDIFGDTELDIRRSKAERRNEKKRHKQSFQNMVRQGRWDEIEELDDF